MNNPIGLLARIFRRSESPNAVIANLFTQAIGRPLMVHPGMGEQLIGAYMRGAVDTRADGSGMIVDAAGSTETKGNRIAVFNISGPLADRPQPGLCDDGPLSYEAIRESFDAAMADDSIGAVIFRMRSPGGMVDGCFDLTDHVFASRGSKPIVAVVDNMAYSACYALAAACDQVWVSRTGGVGSVGVVAYHVDQSAYDAKEGIKVTFMHAGARKVDFSPHVALSEEAYNREMEVINEMYGLFTNSIARYRAINFEDVVATEAGTFNGQAAIDIGFATHLGTFRDALASVAASIAGEDVAGGEAAESDIAAVEGKSASGSLIELKVLPENPTAEDIAAARIELAKAFEMANGDAAAVALLEAIRTDLDAVEAKGRLIAMAENYSKELEKIDEEAEQIQAARAAARSQVLAAVMAATLRDDLKLALLEESAGVTPETVAARIDHARAVADLCAAAGLRGVEADYVKQNTKIDVVRAQLIEAKAEDGPEIITTIPDSALQSPGKLSSSDIYSRRREAAAGLASTQRQ